MNFLFTCGGTAGHINPALAVAGRVRELMPDANILFVGAYGQMETRRVPEAGYEIKTVTITNLQRSLRPDKIMHNIKTVRNVMLSGMQARRIIREFKPDAAIGTGGYVCYPVLSAVRSAGVPTLIHESNAVPGLTTKLLASKATRIMVGFDESRGYYRRPDKVIVTGTPVRSDFKPVDASLAKARLGIPDDKPLVLSFWGSLGSTHMNGVMAEIVKHFENSFRLIHCTGEREYELFMKQVNGIDCEKAGIEIEPYIHNMPDVMAAADLILCRAGASTLAELELMGKPTVFVPSPNVTGNHQEKNARLLESENAAMVLKEGEFDETSLSALVRNLLNDTDKLNAMSENMQRISVPDALDRITSSVLELAMQYRDSQA